ncbi:hypothetical protein LCGC14_2042740 [marine sediment metagenome]|uniref:Uncharacterized protein n=1 Tax=marine sediment metagenome TaxID=412755 RepID=A0A0F9FDX6_9ZZZZ
MPIYDVIYETQGSWLTTIRVEAESMDAARDKADLTDDVLEVSYSDHDTTESLFQGVTEG